MKWIEFIRVQSSGELLRAEIPLIKNQISEIENSLKELEISCAQHALYDGDFAVVLIWRTLTNPQKSLEGLLIAERLQAIGTIDHAVWTMVDSCQHQE